ncbi:transcription factor bHLH94-like [Apium graveolens]|uniref:transcription factor bHLH94-like n=1 Tax=Apium graveolens TaxID=4045 RepID=UPI003D79CAE6
MALETIVFQKDPFTSTYGCKDIYAIDDSEGAYYKGVMLSHFNDSKNQQNMDSTNITWISPPNSSVAQSYAKDYYSPENEVSTDAFFTGTYPPPATAYRRKRRRIKASKNKEEVENQRMTHIAVERNRRKQMNDYLALLRSLMPPSYAQRVRICYLTSKSD